MDLNQKPEGLCEELKQEVQQIAAYVDDRLSQGGKAVLAADVELRSKVQTLTSALESVEGRLANDESELYARLAALEVQESQANNTVQNLSQAIEASFIDLGNRVGARLNMDDRNSGIQDLFGKDRGTGSGR